MDKFYIGALGNVERQNNALYNKKFNHGKSFDVFYCQIIFLLKIIE